jgi:DNA-binding beta-propeller fold protein YncE
VELSVPGGKPRILVREPIDDVALSSDCVFALAQAKREVLKLDPRTKRVIRSWRVERGSRSLVAAPHDIYVAYVNETTGVQRIDLTTGAVTRSPVPNATGLANDQAIAYGGGHLWLADTGTIYRLDLTRLSVDGSTGLAVSDIWFGDGSLWAASDGADGGVERISPATGRVTARVNADAIQIAFSPGIAWLAAARGPTAVQADTARRVATLAPHHVLDDDSAGIAVVGNQVWTTYADLRRLQRVVPIR